MSDQPTDDGPGTAAPIAADPREIAAHLRLDPAHEVLAEIPAWMQDVEVLELAEQVIGTDVVVGGHPLFFLPVPGTGEHIAVLYDRNVAEPLGRELVRFTRSEDDGWFPTVAGLIEIRPGVAVSWPSADGPAEELAVVPIGVEQPARSHAIRAWLERYDGATEAAALVLEPLDPDLTISDADRALWRTALRVDAFELRFRMDDDDRSALREHCAENRVYRFIRDALSDPAGDDGLRLFEELTDGDILTARF